MKKCKFIFVLISMIFIVLSFKTPAKINVWMIGDSTMANKKPDKAPETGWGMVLSEYVKAGVVVHNHAINGRSSKSFISEGRWKAVFDSIQPGDFVIIQFGHNDEKTDSARHTDAKTSYKMYLKKYIDDTRQKGAFPIVCSSIVRRNFDGSGNLVQTHGDYIEAACQIALETKTPYIDMEAKSRKFVADLGQEESKMLYLFCKPGEFANRPNGVRDSTHLNTYGAHQVAQLFITGVKEQKLALKKYFK